jgi:hypothetical protein
MTVYVNKENGAKIVTESVVIAPNWDKVEEAKEKKTKNTKAE